MNAAAVVGAMLWPLKWAVEAILVGAHALLGGAGLPGGAAWVLALVLLVVAVRGALLPLTVVQVRAQRAASVLAPRLHELQQRRRGTDRASREALARETAALYRESGTNPLASCLAVALQAPILLALVQVLETAARAGAGVGMLDAALAASFGAASLFGAPLSATVLSATGGPAAVVVGVALALLLVSVQFATQRVLLPYNTPLSQLDSPGYRRQRLVASALPVVSLVSGVTFPLGVTLYWLCSGLWTAAQQLTVAVLVPTPGSRAAADRTARLGRRG